MSRDANVYVHYVLLVFTSRVADVLLVVYTHLSPRPRTYPTMLMTASERV